MLRHTNTCPTLPTWSITVTHVIKTITPTMFLTRFRQPATVLLSYRPIPPKNKMGKQMKSKIVSIMFKMDFSILTKPTSPLLNPPESYPLNPPTPLLLTLLTLEVLVEHTSVPQLTTTDLIKPIILWTTGKPKNPSPLCTRPIPRHLANTLLLGPCMEAVTFPGLSTTIFLTSVRFLMEAPRAPPST